MSCVVANLARSNVKQYFQYHTFVYDPGIIALWADPWKVLTPLSHHSWTDNMMPSNNWTSMSRRHFELVKRGCASPPGDLTVKVVLDHRFEWKLLVRTLIVRLLSWAHGCRSCTFHIHSSIGCAQRVQLHAWPPIHRKNDAIQTLNKRYRSLGVLSLLSGVLVFQTRLAISLWNNQCLNGFAESGKRWEDTFWRSQRVHRSARQRLFARHSRYTFFVKPATLWPCHSSRKFTQTFWKRLLFSSLQKDMLVYDNAVHGASVVQDNCIGFVQHDSV